MATHAVGHDGQELALGKEERVLIVVALHPDVGVARETNAHAVQRKRSAHGWTGIVTLRRPPINEWAVSRSAAPGPARSRPAPGPDTGHRRWCKSWTRSRRARPSGARPPRCTPAWGRSPA